MRWRIRKAGQGSLLLMGDESMAPEKRPTREQLLALYAAAADYRQAEPWKRLYDADLICVENPADKTIGYCSVMGRMGQHYGLCVFVGLRGLAGFFQLMEEGDEAAFSEVAFAQDYLLLSFENRSDLDERDLEEITSLGLSFQGRKAWPQFRRYEPGYHPWYLSGAEAVFFTHALQQVLAVFEEYQREEVELDFDRRRTVLRQSEEKDGQLIWYTRPLELLRPVLQYEPVKMENELLLRQLRKAPRSINSVWELDVCYLPVTIQPDERERPRFPRGFVLADHKSGMVLDCHAYETPAEDAGQVIDRLSQHIINYGMPKEIRVKSDLLVAILADLCSRAGIALKRVAGLPKVESLLDEMEEWF